MTRTLFTLVVLALALAGCDPPCTPRWRTVHDALDRVALSAWASPDGAVYVAGGGLGNAGHGALALRFDGATATPLPIDRPETLWWVWGSGADDVWFVGEHGLVLRWDGAAAHAVDSGTDATLFGVWGTGPDDVWIVGGKPDGQAGADDDLLLHWDGVALTRDTALPARGAALFKVWGAGPDDLWLVGEGGTVWRRRGGVFEDHAPALATAASLFTAHGCGADEVYVTGGSKVWRFDGAAWAPLAGLPALYGATGVACGADEVLVVGLGGTKLRVARPGGAVVDDTSVAPWDTDFHGALVDRAGVAWAVGGEFLAATGSGPRRGVIARHACE